jgi:hypothetical protein
VAHCLVCEPRFLGAPLGNKKVPGKGDHKNRMIGIMPTIRETEESFLTQRNSKNSSF